MGHVDHGKTTLLDYIRRTKIAQKEAGGITQGIGASVVVDAEGKKITFIDTPGHAAFSGMRSQGARVADIAVLVVGGDDGVKPQTKEALEHIIAAGIPYLVAATKSDLQSFSKDLVKSQLEKEGVMFEGSGGDVPLVEVSAKTGKGVDGVLEMISLLSELKGISGNSDDPLEAVIIEVGLDKGGVTASAIVRNGSLKVGDTIVSQDQEAKVRALFNFAGKSVREIGPGEPCLILGFAVSPAVGSSLWHKGTKVEVALPTTANKLQAVPFAKVVEKPLSLIIKAKTSGSLEAIIAGLNTNVFVLSSGVGPITESDVFMAKTDGAKIFAFELTVPGSVTKLSEMEGVKIETFDIIYKLFERVDEILKKGEIEILGKAQVIASFPYENKKVAGCKITFGRIAVGESVSITRDDKDVGIVKVISIKKMKEDITSAKQGEECGILFVPQLDFKTGDMLISVRK
jgi:translation initiation factor IF-2